METRNTLTINELSNVPAIITTSHSENLSARYLQINTMNIIEELQKADWQPFNYFSKKQFGFHMINFGTPTSKFQEGNIDLTLTNSHDGTTRFKLYVRVYRLVCSNGLIAPTDAFGVNFKHMGNQDQIKEHIKEQIGFVIEYSQSVKNLIGQFIATELTTDQKLQFAQQAGELKWGTESKISPTDLIIPRREIDNKPTLWHTFNTVQENMIKGGITYQTQTQRRTLTTRPVKNPIVDLQLNKNLWQLASSFVNN